jgi:hypothetical protein
LSMYQNPMTVCSTGLPHKLHKAGLLNSMFQLLEPYLTSQKFRVKADNHSSEWKLLHEGVP